MSAVLLRLRGSLLGGSSLRGTLAIMAGAGGAQVVVIAAQPILTRLYTPADYGIFGVAAALLSIITAVVCLRYEYAIPIAEDETAAANLFALSLITAAVVTLVVAVFLMVASPALATATGSPELAPYVQLLAVAAIGGGIIHAFTGLATRAKAYSAIAMNRFVVGIGTVVTQVTLGALGWGATGLLTGTAGGSLAGSLRYAFTAVLGDVGIFRSVSRAGIVVVARRYRRFPMLAAPSALLNAIGIQLPLLLFVAFFGAEAGGLFALAERVIGLPVVLVALAVGYTYHGDAARAARDDPLAVRDVFVRTTRTLTLVAIGPAILATVLSPLLFGLVFGEAWAPAGLYVSILAPMYFLLTVFSPTGSTLDVLERQELHLVRELARIVLVGGAVIASAAADLPTTTAVAVISLAGCVAYVCYGAISWYAIISSERALSGRSRT